MREELKGVTGFCFTLAITVGLLLLLLREIPLLDILGIVRAADKWILTSTVVISIISNIGISAYRWRLILECWGCNISLWESLLMTTGSVSIIGILPLRMGDLSRALYLKRRQDVPLAKAGMVIISEHLLTLLALLLCVVVGLALYAARAPVPGLGSDAGIVLLCLLVLGLVGARLGSSPAEGSGQDWSAWRTNVALLKKLFTDGPILLLTGVFVCSELLVVGLLSIALHNPLPIHALLVFIPIIRLLSSVPVTVAGMGTRELCMVLFLSDFAPPEVLLSMGGLYSFVDYLFPMLIGTSMTGPFVRGMLWRRN